MDRFVESNAICQGIIWGVEALACMLLAVRITSRLRSQRRLFWDDGFIIFAFILTLITAALWQWAAPTMYWTLQISEGTREISISFDDYFENLKLWLRVTFLAAIFFYASLTAVKMSFLLFFRRLGDRVYGFNWFWWPIFLFVLSTWVIGIGTSAKEAECELPKSLEVLFDGCQASAFTSFDAAVIKAMCVLDVMSDFLSEFRPSSTSFAARYADVQLVYLSCIDPGGVALERPDAASQKASLLRTLFAISHHHGYRHCKSG